MPPERERWAARALAVVLLLCIAGISWFLTRGEPADSNQGVPARDSGERKPTTHPHDGNLQEQSTKEGLLPITGRCVSALTREPVPKATITAGAGEVVSEQDGRFAIPRFTEGKLTLHIRADGFVSSEISWDEERRPLQLGDVHLRPISYLRGTVLTAAGDPASGARVALIGRDGTIYHRDTSSDSGSFRLPLTAVRKHYPQRGHVYAWHERHGAARESFYKPPSSLVLRLRAGDRLKGVVLAARTGEPLSGVGVFLQPKGNRRLESLTRVGETVPLPRSSCRLRSSKNRAHR